MWDSTFKPIGLRLTVNGSYTCVYTKNDISKLFCVNRILKCNVFEKYVEKIHIEGNIFNSTLQCLLHKKA